MLLKVAALAAAVHAAAAFSPLAARLPRARRSARLTTAVPIAGAGREAAPTDLTLGAPAYRPRDIRYTTEGGVEVTRTVKSIQDGALEIEHMVTGLDSARGCVFASSYEFPGRYTRWTIGFLDPPLEVVGRKDQYTVTALNPRGTVLLPAILAALKRCAAVSSVQYDARGGEQGCGFLVGAMAPRVEVATEEERSKQPSIMSLVRAIKELFSHDEEPQLGLCVSYSCATRRRAARNHQPTQHNNRTSPALTRPPRTGTAPSGTTSPSSSSRSSWPRPGPTPSATWSCTSPTGWW